LLRNISTLSYFAFNYKSKFDILISMFFMADFLCNPEILVPEIICAIR